MFARSLVVLATLGLCVGVDIKFPKLQERPPLQFSPKLPAKPLWVQPKVPLNGVGPHVRFPDDPSQTVKIFENYTSTNVEKSQDGKNISVIELLGILHDLPPNETLSAVNQRITSTTESNLETLNRLRKTKLDEIRDDKISFESSTMTTTSETTFTTLNPADTAEISTLPLTLETTTVSIFSHLDQIGEMVTTSLLPFIVVDNSILPDEEQIPSEIIDFDENKLVNVMSSSEFIDPSFSTSTVSSQDVKEESHIFRPEDGPVVFKDENEVTKTEVTTANAKLNKSNETLEESQPEEITIEATTTKAVKIYTQTTWSQDCSDGLNISRCFPDNSSNASLDVVLIGSISGGIFLVLVIVISILSICLCKRSHNRKNVYATMEEEQPKDFTKVGPPVILQDEVFEAGRSRLYTRNTDKVTEL